jgi:3-oxoacyl-[acyl-carrier-protein] synthase-3
LKTYIAGTGTKLPERRITNSYFLNHVFMDENGVPNPKPQADIIAKLEQITGIKERGYISEKGDSVPLMVDASLAALADWGKDKNLIDGIIVAHNAGNMLEGRQGFHTVPNMAALLKNRLGITNHECFAYDLLFGCPGWLQGVIQAHQAIQMGDAKHVLVVGLEVASRLLDPHDLDSLILADGCGAAVISGTANEQEGIISYATYSHALDDISCIYLDRSYNKELEAPTLFKMHGKDVYKYATGISAAVALASQVLESGDASRYLDFLRSGGSRFPIETLSAAGVDMDSPAPIQAALDLFARRVAELKDLIG